MFGRIFRVRQGMLGSSVAGNDDEVRILDQGQILRIIHRRMDIKPVGILGRLELRLDQLPDFIVVVGILVVSRRPPNDQDILFLRNRRSQAAAQ